MSNALFLPRELFATPVSASPVATAAAEPTPRAAARKLGFASGEAVAADLLSTLTPVETSTPPERRRQPRPAHARGVDLYIA